MTRSVSIFGATGSIGTSTLDVLDQHRDDFAVEVLTAHRDVAGLAQAARGTGAKLAVIGDETLRAPLADALSGTGTEVAAGRQALLEAADRPVDWTMAAIVGTAGLEPVMRSLRHGRTVALANKEALVSAGALMTDAARRHGATILPVDSEHNAVFQCLAGSRREDVAQIILTASGGPFRTASAAQIAAATPVEAVAHPNWSMGAKISVDSATMMNKGLELIEARWLFDIMPPDLGVVVHPQSIVHSLVAYRDGSLLAQLGSPDMRIPIAYTLGHPARIATRATLLDLAATGRLDFEPVDDARFPAVSLALGTLTAGVSAPAVLNAANEVAVEAFLQERLGFARITALVEETLSSCDVDAVPGSVDDVMAIDSEARARANALMRRAA